MKTVVLTKSKKGNGFLFINEIVLFEIVLFEIVLFEIVLFEIK